MTEQAGDGWVEYRLLVTAMLERHDLAIEACELFEHETRTEIRAELSECKANIRDLVDAKFIQLGEMSATQLKNAKRELIDVIEDSKKEATEISVAKITSRWEFWGMVIVQVSTIVIALIALLN